MLGEFVTRCLVLLFGYAYPALECFKSVEKNKVDVQEVVFWCRYWIIIAIITVVERIGDAFLSWLPMYGELKLAFFIYLWYPKTKGTGYVYDALLRPFVARHETDIETKLNEMKVRAWDFAIYYWHNCTELGQTKIFDAINYVLGQSRSLPNNNTEKRNGYEPSAPPLPVPAPNDLPSLTNHTSKQRKWPPRPPPAGGSTINRAVSDPPKSNLVQVRLDEETKSLRMIDPDTTTNLQPDANEKLHEIRKRLRRLRPNQH